MSERTTPEPPGQARATAGERHHRGTAPFPEGGDGVDTDRHSAKARFEAVSQPLLDRFEEPISRVNTITQKTLALFPVRVWRHFLARNGFILAAGLSYQALFAIFAAVYVVFAVAGIWLTSNDETLNAFIALLNSYAPGLIGPDGIISNETLTEIAQSSAGVFGWTGAVALVGLIWTAIGWITYARMSVRSIFGLPKDTRAYALLKARDFLAGLFFGAVLLAASVLTVASTSFVSWVFDVLDLPNASGWESFLVQFGSILVVFVIDTLALAVMFRFLSGAAMPWRRMWVGSLLGSGAISVMQMLSGLLVQGASRNPLLATFTVFIALLLWFHLTSIVILTAASWIAVEAADANETLRNVSAEQLEAEARQRERDALLTAAQVRVREARGELASSNWFERLPAKRRLARAEQSLADLEAQQRAERPRAKRVGGLP
ncbi:YihY/virulence factor BrkB family protein [Agromyces italicus]|uniref:YihY/virulence factor BrkB family protein n=1 Tax=Agromyces italicus TaxID=279572 RepID=UPI0003B5883C|nr:YihY/virulence factor BrkB family protein [Agromyces italicus]